MILTTNDLLRDPLEENTLPPTKQIRSARLPVDKRDDEVCLGRLHGSWEEGRRDGSLRAFP